MQEKLAGTPGGYATFMGRMIDMFINSTQEIQTSVGKTSFVTRAGVEVCC